MVAAAEIRAPGVSVAIARVLPEGEKELAVARQVAPAFPAAQIGRTECGLESPGEAVHLHTQEGSQKLGQSEKLGLRGIVQKQVANQKELDRRWRERAAKERRKSDSRSSRAADG